MSKLLTVFVFLFLLAPFVRADSPQVTSSTIGDGTSQRSVVTQMSFSFDQSVEATLLPESLTLTNLNTQTQVATAVAYDAANNVATLTFPNETGGVLPNGNYQLIISGLEVANEFGELLDGNGDGTGGDDYVISTFRYFADFDGDRDVDFQDTGRFRAAYLSAAGDANYRADADSDADGDIDAADLEAFKNTYLTTLSGLATTPDILNPPTITGDREVTLTGTTSASSTVVVSNGDQAYQVFSDETGNFSITVPLFSNRINYLFARGDAFGGDLSSLTPLTITQDSQPPFLFIDIPSDGAEVSSEFITVTGRVGDILGGFEGLTVTANGDAATIIPGVGTNGTFEKKDVPLQPGANTVTIVAKDSLGNSITQNVTVNRLASPQIQIVAGNDQHAERNSELAQPVVVKLTDVGDRPFADKIVTFKVSRSDGRLATMQGATTDSEEMMVQVRSDAQGMARAYWRVGSDAGQSNNQLRVTSAGLRGAALFTASANCRPASQINVGTGGNQIGEAGAEAPQPLNAWVSDDLNGVPMTPVTFTVVSGDGSLDGQQSVTVSTGVTGHAATILTLGESGGEVRVEADFPGNVGRPAVFVARGLVRNPNQPTSFSGVVLDNSNLPIGGASVTLTTNGISYGPIASNADGVFTFSEVTAGAGFLDVDGSNATSLNGQPLTEPRRYPKLHYQVTVVPNAENSLPTTVLLPTLNPANERAYDGTQDVELTIDGIAGLRMLVKAGSMTLANGTIPDVQNPVVMSLNQVHADNIPMPIQDGVAPLLTWTLQPAGAHFDPPIEVTYPNMSCLPSGAAANLLSYNHDTERFEVVAAATVVEDGSVIKSDPGSGITISGWGCNCPPYSATGDCEGPFSLSIGDNSTDEEQRYEGNPEDGEEPYSYSWKIGSVEVSTAKIYTAPEPDEKYGIVPVMLTLEVTDNTGTKKTEMQQIDVNLDLATDWDRDGEIKDTDFKIDEVFRFWINDDNDEDAVGQALDDLPGSSSPNHSEFSNVFSSLRVNGPRDLVDFFPLGIKLGSSKEIFDKNKFSFQLRHRTRAANYFYSKLSFTEVSEIHRKYFTSGFGTNLTESAHTAKVEAVASLGNTKNLATEFVDHLYTSTDGEGVLYLEGVRNTEEPLEILILDDSGKLVAKSEFPIRFSSVLEMYRVLNLRQSDQKFLNGGAGLGPLVTNLNDPNNYPDEYARQNKDLKTLVNIHGFDWGERESPAGHSEMFKRFYQLGSKARFIGVSWFSDQRSPFDYYENVTNSFITAFHLKEQLSEYFGVSTSIFAHSLGNMVASSLLKDYDIKVKNYFMVNAAVPQEAYKDYAYGDESLMRSLHLPDSVSPMVNNRWLNLGSSSEDYPLVGTASGWHSLFASTDRRSSLTWSSRFGGVSASSGANLVNFFSREEDVLANPIPLDQDGGSTVPNLICDIVLPGTWLGTVLCGEQREFVWVYSEMTKGRSGQILSLDIHGGWGFREPEIGRLSPADVLSLTNNELIDPKVFNRFSDEAGGVNPFVSDDDFPLWENGEWLYDISEIEPNLRLPDITNGIQDDELNSLKNHARILAEAIPALSSPVGANPFNDLRIATDVDLQDYVVRGMWPRANNRWLHGDYKDLPLIDVRGVFEYCVSEIEDD